MIDVNIQLHSTLVESLAHALEQVLTAEKEPEPEPTIPSTEKPALENETTTLENTSENVNIVLEETVIEIRVNQNNISCSVGQKTISQ